MFNGEAVGDKCECSTVRNGSGLHSLYYGVGWMQGAGSLTEPPESRVNWLVYGAVICYPYLHEYRGANRFKTGQPFWVFFRDHSAWK